MTLCLIKEQHFYEIEAVKYSSLDESTREVKLRVLLKGQEPRAVGGAAVSWQEGLCGKM